MSLYGVLHAIHNDEMTLEDLARGVQSSPCSPVSVLGPEAR